MPKGIGRPDNRPEKMASKLAKKVMTGEASPLQMVGAMNVGAARHKKEQDRAEGGKSGRLTGKQSEASTKRERLK